MHKGRGGKLSEIFSFLHFVCANALTLQNIQTEQILGNCCQNLSLAYNRNTTGFRISDFSLALKKMTEFFQFLDPAVIYLSFRDPENEHLIARKTELARTNIEVAIRYMYCERLSIAVVAAIAELSGGDAPLSLSLGDLQERHHLSTSIEDHMEPLDDVLVAGGIESRLGLWNGLSSLLQHNYRNFRSSMRTRTRWIRWRKNGGGRRFYDWAGRKKSFFNWSKPSKLPTGKKMVVSTVVQREEYDIYVASMEERTSRLDKI